MAAAEMAKLGFSVFTEMGDIARYDLIVDVDECLIKVQVKYIPKECGAYKLSSRKTGPGYNYVYSREDVDLFGVYCADDDRFCWVLADDFLGDPTMRCLSLRFANSPTRNSQTSGVVRAENYTDLALALERIKASKVNLD